MTKYENARIVVKAKYGTSEEFKGKGLAHQGSVLNPLLFVIVMEVLTSKVTDGLS